MAYWHSLAKMRMHLESSLKLLENACSVMGVCLRHFEQVICPRYATKETVREYTSRIRNQSEMARDSSSASARVAGRRARTFELSTIKLHLLGDYPEFIREYGTAEALSTSTVR